MLLVLLSVLIVHSFLPVAAMSDHGLVSSYPPVSLHPHTCPLSLSHDLILYLTGLKKVSGTSSIVPYVEWTQCDYLTPIYFNQTCILKSPLKPLHPSSSKLALFITHSLHWSTGLEKRLNLPGLISGFETLLPLTLTGKRNGEKLGALFFGMKGRTLRCRCIEQITVTHCSHFSPLQIPLVLQCVYLRHILCS